MGEWTAIVLAGRRPGENGFAASHGVAAKALIRAGGEPMLGRVARTLLDSPSIGRIVVLAQEAGGAAGRRARLDGRGTRGSPPPKSGDGISASVGRLAGTEAAPYPVLVTTADHPLLRPEMVEAFIAGAAGVDVAFAMVERRTVEKAHPDTRRTWLKAANGHFSGANLFALMTPASMRGTDFWARAEKDRKRTLKLLSFLGLGIFLRAVTRTISLEAAAERAGRKAGFRLKAVLLPFAEAAIDVDKQADLELAERILAARAALPAAAAAAAAAAAGRSAAP